METARKTLRHTPYGFHLLRWTLMLYSFGVRSVTVPPAGWLSELQVVNCSTVHVLYSDCLNRMFIKLACMFMQHGFPTPVLHKQIQSKGPLFIFFQSMYNMTKLTHYINTKTFTSFTVLNLFLIKKYKRRQFIFV